MQWLQQRQRSAWRIGSHGFTGGKAKRVRDPFPLSKSISSTSEAKGRFYEIQQNSNHEEKENNGNKAILSSLPLLKTPKVKTQQKYNDGFNSGNLCKKEYGKYEDNIIEN